MLQAAKRAGAAAMAAAAAAREDWVPDRPAECREQSRRAATIVIRWAGSPAASSTTGSKLSGAYALAEQLGSVNAAATQLAPPGRRCAKQGGEFRPMLSPLGVGCQWGERLPGNLRFSRRVPGPAGHSNTRPGPSRGHCAPPSGIRPAPRISP
jgi:hypothetical protein